MFFFQSDVDKLFFAIFLLPMLFMQKFKDLSLFFRRLWNAEWTLVLSFVRLFCLFLLELQLLVTTLHFMNTWVQLLSVLVYLLDLLFFNALVTFLLPLALGIHHRRFVFRLWLLSLLGLGGHELEGVWLGNVFLLDSASKVYLLLWNWRNFRVMSRWNFAQILVLDLRSYAFDLVLSSRSIFRGRRLVDGLQGYWMTFWVVVSRVEKLVGVFLLTRAGGAGAGGRLGWAVDGNIEFISGGHGWPQ